jgi:hypothetical protein
MAFDYVPYQQKQRALTEGLGAKKSANIYAQFLNKQRGNRQIADLTNTWKDKVPGLIGGYTQRGLAGPGVQSGIFQKGLTRFDTQRQTAMNDLSSTINDQDQVYRNQLLSAEAQTANDLADLELQKQRDIAASAATLSAFKPYLG